MRLKILRKVKCRPCSVSEIALEVAAKNARGNMELESLKQQE